MENKELIQDLLNALHHSARLEVRLTAWPNILMLTGTDEGRLFIRQNKKLIEMVLENIIDFDPRIQCDAIFTLVNLSADDAFCHIVIEQYDILPTLLKLVKDSKSRNSDKAAAILSNFTKNPVAAGKIWKLLENEMVELLAIYQKISYNTENQKLDHLGALFANLTQCPKARLFFLNKETLHLQKQILFLNHERKTRRGATAILIKNICFVSDDNHWLLGPSVDILPALLMPLAGGPEIANLDMDDMEKLPDQLQFLEETKEREEDSDIRKMIVESLFLLCNKKEDRCYIRDKNTYVILRELHKFELALAEESENNNAIQQVIDLMIGDDEADKDLRDIEVPEAMQKKLKEKDEMDLEEIAKYERGERDDPEDCKNIIMMG